jgi:hypothetical protein
MSIAEFIIERASARPVGSAHHATGRSSQARFASGVISGENAAGFEQKTCDPRSNQRRDDKQPHLSQRSRLGTHANDGRTERARRVDRNARHVDPDNMDSDQRQPDSQAGELRGSTLLRRAENADQKQKGRDDLEDESREHIVLAEVTWAPAILSQTSGPACRFTGEDNVKDDCAGNCAQDLRNDVRNKTLVVMRPATSTPKLTAGLTWQPEIGPIP